MKKKVTFELSAEDIEWKELLEKLNKIVDNTCKEISSLEISYSEHDEDNV